MFSRYQSEQINQIPAGYVEGMSSWGRMAQNLGSNIASMMTQNRAEEMKSKENEIASKKTNIDERKADALDTANRLKEQGLTQESVYKGYESAHKAEQEGFLRSESGLKAISSLHSSAQGVLRDPESTPEMRAEATKQLQELTPQLKAANERMAQWATKPVLTFEDYQHSLEVKKENLERQRTLKAPPGVARPPAGSTSFYQSPAFNPASVTGEPQNATKTIAYGGSAKKVELVGGRVNALVNSDGSKVAVSGEIPESALPSAVEFASKFGDFSSSPSSSEAEQGAPVAEPVAERVELKGHFGKSYVQSEPMQSISEMSTSPVSGTIVWEETVDSAGTKTRTPSLRFNSKSLTNADGTPNEASQQNFRLLSLMREAIDDESYRDVRPTATEIDTARTLFGTKDNAYDMPAIAQAYALVNRNVNAGPGTYDTNADYFGIRFEQTYKMFPSQFMANGEKANELEITPSTSAILEKTEQARLSKKFEEIGSAPDRPPGLDASIESTKSDYDSLVKASKFVASELATAPPGSDYEKQLKSRQEANNQKIRLLDSKMKMNEGLLNNWQVEMKRFEGRQTAIAQELDIDLKAQQLEAGRVSMAEKWSAASARWIGTKESDRAQYSGFIAVGLRDIGGRTMKIPILDVSGKPTGRFYRDRLDAAETIVELKKAARYKDLIDLSSGMPTEDHINNAKTGILITNSKLKDTIPLLQAMKKQNDYFMKLGKKGIVGEIQVAFEKLWLPDASFATGTTLQKSLVGKIREAVVGPGNPSNYEQEVINSIVPNATDLLTRPERQDARIKALATMAILDHMTKMQANKMEPTDEAYKLYNAQLGSVIGEKITPAFFNGLVNDYSSTRRIYSNKQAQGAEDVSVAKQYAERLIDILDARVKPTGK
jgi:hypothetical protein